MTMTDPAAVRRPRIALAIGCLAGIAPELTARILAGSRGERGRANCRDWRSSRDCAGRRDWRRGIDLDHLGPDMKLLERILQAALHQSG